MKQTESSQEQERLASKPISRRNALKIIVATTSAATLSNLPGQWLKPVLRAGVLPAHAQTSGQPTANPNPTAANTATPTATATNTPTSTPTNTPTATATPQILQGSLATMVEWSFEVGQMDLNLEVYDPGSGTWATPSNLNTLTLVHGGDSGLSGLGTEMVDSTGGVVAGTYQIWLRVVATDASQGFLIFAFIDITANATNDNRSIEFATPPADNSTIHVADVTYPAGTITWYIP